MRLGFVARGSGLMRLGSVCLSLASDTRRRLVGLFWVGISDEKSTCLFCLNLNFMKFDANITFPDEPVEDHRQLGLQTAAPDIAVFGDQVKLKLGWQSASFESL